MSRIIRFLKKSVSIYQLKVLIKLKMNKMKKKLWIASLILSGYTLSAQSTDFGTLSFSIGGNLTVAGTTLEADYGLIKEYDTSSVIAAIVPLQANLGLTKFLSVNASFGFGAWLDDDWADDSLVIDKKEIMDFSVGARLIPINADNFNLYFGADVGYSVLTKETETKVLVIKNEQNWEGLNLDLNLGFDAYFGSDFGMYMQVGYNQRSFNLKNYALNNVDLLANNNFDYNLLTKGGYLELGIIFKLDNE